MKTEHQIIRDALIALLDAIESDDDDRIEAALRNARRVLHRVGDALI